MLGQATKRKLDSTRQILVGKVPDPKAQVEQITTALIYKFIDDMDKKNKEVGLNSKDLRIWISLRKNIINIAKLNILNTKNIYQRLNFYL